MGSLAPSLWEFCRDLLSPSLSIQLRDLLSGLSIAFTIRSVDRSLFIRLIAGDFYRTYYQSLIAPYKKWWAVPTLLTPHLGVEPIIIFTLR